MLCFTIMGKNCKRKSKCKVYYTTGWEGKNGAKCFFTPIGPMPGPPPPCGMQNVLWRLRWQTSAPIQPGLVRPTCKNKILRLNIRHEKNLVQFNICCLKIVLVCDFSSMYLNLQGLVQQCDLNLVQDFQLADNLETINNL